MSSLRSATFVALLSIGLVLGSTVTSTAALAQQVREPRVRWRPPEGAPGQASLDEARALFLAGSSAVEAGRWSDALSNFERSYALSGVAAALYNAATALRALGRHREARDAFVALFRNHPELDDETSASARTMLAEERSRVAVLSLTGLPENDVIVRFDEAQTPDLGERPMTIETDAGEHNLRVERAQHEPFLWSGILTDGQREEVRVVLTPIDDSGFFGSTVFWILTGVVVLGAGAGVGYYLYDDAQLDPSSPNVINL